MSHATSRSSSPSDPPARDASAMTDLSHVAERLRRITVEVRDDAGTVGIVHALGPVVRGGRTWIQADLRLGPGNSGGPIADGAGRVVGVSTMVMSTLALAVPIADVQRFVRGMGIPV